MSVATSAKALRAFFKHAALRGWCTATIATGIDGPRLFRHEGLPTGPSWPDVKRLIATTVGDSARDIRDRAILILLATYGLRSGEVSGLRLEDVNWESEKVSIWRSKQRRAQEYPLVSEAGEAILNYLQEARHLRAQREIFLTSKAPFHRLSQGALYHLVSTRLSVLGIHTATPWTARSTPRLCRPPGGGAIFAKGDWRSSRAPQRFCHSYLCQGGSGRITRGSEFRSGRSAMKLSDLASRVCRL